MWYQCNATKKDATKKDATKKDTTKKDTTKKDTTKKYEIKKYTTNKDAIEKDTTQKYNSYIAERFSRLCICLLLSSIRFPLHIFPSVPLRSWISVCFICFRTLF